MKIICVGRNYVAHALELQNEVPDEPVLFMKPESAYLYYKDKFHYPKFTQDLHYECELVLKVSQTGTNLTAENAFDYVDEISLGIDFTARDIQTKLKAKSLPWEKAKAFDHSAIIGDFIPFTAEMKSQHLLYTLEKNDAIMQNGDTDLMIFPMRNLIAAITQYFTIEPGDLIFTGTPAGVGASKIGDHFIGKLGSEELLEFTIYE